MTDAPLPPPSATGAVPAASTSDSGHREVRLSEGWKSVMVVTWLLVLGAMVAVAVSSRTIGRPIWWLGPSVDPAPLVFVLVPLSICLIPVWRAVRSTGQGARTGIICAVLLISTVLPDIGERPGTATAVIVVGVAALISNVAIAVATRH